MRFVLILALLTVSAGCRELSREQEAARRMIIAKSTKGPHVQALAHLIDWDRLDALTGQRAAVPAFLKACYHLEAARREGAHLDLLIGAVHEKNGVRHTKRARAQATTLTRNHYLLKSMGCLNEVGMANLKKGKAPMIVKGKRSRELASVDHILPFRIVPELGNRLYNLHILGEAPKQSKGDHISYADLASADHWLEDGLLSEEGLKAVEAVVMSQIASEWRSKHTLDR